MSLENIETSLWPNKPDLNVFDYFKKISIPEIYQGVEEINASKINKHLVHKHNADNVVISEPVKDGAVWYFKMFNHTDEFRFDHDSDHIQGMFLMEAARQAAIATTHLEGLSLEGIITLKKFNIEFINFANSSESIVIRTASRPVQTKKGKFYQYVFVNFIQNGKILTNAIIEGMAFESNEVAQKYLNFFSGREKND